MPPALINPVAAARASKEDQGLVSEHSAATAGEDGRANDQTCSLLLARAGGEPPNAAVVWTHGAAVAGSAGARKVALGVERSRTWRKVEAGTEGAVSTVTKMGHLLVWSHRESRQALTCGCAGDRWVYTTAVRMPKWKLWAIRCDLRRWHPVRRTGVPDTQGSWNRKGPARSFARSGEN